MGILYRIDKEQGIAFTVWDGAITPDEQMAHLQRMAADPDWPAKNRMLLVDLRTTTAYKNFDDTTLKRVVAYLSERRANIANMKIAIVAHEAYEMSNLFQRLVKIYPLTMIVFNDLHTACTWLGVDAGKAEHTLQQLRSQLREGSSQEKTGGK